MPFLGAALTTIVAMLGQMLMGVIIDHFGLGVRKNPITLRKFSGLIAIARDYSVTPLLVLQHYISIFI